MRFFAVLPIVASLVLSACAALNDSAPQSSADAPASYSAAKAAAPVPSRPFPDDAFSDLLVAEMAMRNQDLQTALAKYQQQADITGDTGVIATTARLAQFLRDNETTEKYARQWLQREPDNPEIHFVLATALSRQQKPLAALPHMTRVLELGGDANFAALAAAALSRPEQQLEDFRLQLDGIAKRYPHDNSVRIARALIFQYQQQEEKALKLVRQVLDEDPDNAHALLIETRTLKQLGRDGEAIDRMKHAVDQNPSNKRLRHDLARSLVKTDLYQAKAQYEVLSRQFPGDTDVLLELMLVNRELDRFDEAEEQLRQLIASEDQSSRAHFVLGRLAEEDRDWQTALEHYQAASYGEEFDRAVRRLAALSAAEESTDRALARLAALREDLPQHAVTLYLLEAELLRTSAQPQRGFDLLSDALAEHPDDEGLRYARSLFAEKLGNIEVVENDLRHILKRDPNNAAALNALGYTLANLTSRLDEAEQLVKRALQQEPDDPAIIDSYGWILLLKGQVEEAVTWLEKAFAQTQDHEIAAHLGEALWQAGDQQRAKSVWKQGLEHTPNSPIIYDTLRRLKLMND
ncbi:tetratricopeptide repeat protein [Spongiibacter nanhainus]|uniref:Tetratricopeptide repeat protein n=1 Tax=Spongiibacter nanhainus TaxID=2794344 RepID=A0A7T4QZF7_9GAMM|nr:tetratricopeptide repeat protein [Spongiibacter nanhainus]QQD17649.1 tetratricopeptide repeat protein [Spongiibacter nanhainus]